MGNTFNVFPDFFQTLLVYILESGIASVSMKMAKTFVVSISIHIYAE